MRNLIIFCSIAAGLIIAMVYTLAGDTWSGMLACWSGFAVAGLVASVGVKPVSHDSSED